MKYYHFLLYCAFLYTLVGCGPSIRGDIRNYYEGTVTNSIGEPLEGIPVYFRSEDFELGKSITDANGFYSFYALEASGGNPDFIFGVNTGYYWNDTYDEGNYAYTNYRLYQDYTEDRIYKKDIVLYQIKKVNINITKVTDSQATLTYHIAYNDIRCEESLYEEDNYPYECYEIRPYSNELTDNNPNLRFSFYYATVADPIFYYQLNNEQQVTVEIPTTEDETTITIEY